MVKMWRSEWMHRWDVLVGLLYGMDNFKIDAMSKSSDLQLSITTLNLTQILDIS